MEEDSNLLELRNRCCLREDYDYGEDEVSKEAEKSDEEARNLGSKSYLDASDDTSSSSSSDTLSEYTDSLSEEEVDESLASTILQEIQQGTYTCLVCISEIDPYSEVWSCSNCFRVYDLDCIRDWSIRGSTKNSERKTWRCPSCNIESKDVPKKFACWCGRVSNPKPNPSNPFSCDNVCGKKYESCIHRCSSVCHPGKHPVCGAMGPVLKCRCGSFERQLPCLITPYQDSWLCDKRCEVTVCDMGHTCPQGGCHLGFCGPCNELVSVKCYCGEEEKKIVCEQRMPKRCFSTTGDEWVGQTACSNISKSYYDCGIHYEKLKCLPRSPNPKPCKHSPALVKTCHCGKKKVDTGGRKFCTDPIPECDNVCGKLLDCGCTCLLKCHPGECVCFNKLEAKCSCENYTFLVPCKFLQNGSAPKCNHKCPVLLNCRRHVHREVCCASEQAGLRRERIKKKELRNRVRSNISAEEELMTMEPAHICTRTCNRLKQCGKHYCEAMCHSGSCEVCLESFNDDLYCHCGRTVIPAPVRCGTEVVCHEQCIREKPCGHEPEPHECHGDERSCPKCVKLTSKRCNCGLKEVSRVLCSQTNVSCGTVCHSSKDCGHVCMRVCSLECTGKNVHASSALCQSPCRKIRSLCPHACKQKCHQNKVGKSQKCDAVSCKEPVTINCQCKRITKVVPCNSSLSESTSIGNVLECDDECSKEKKMFELKRALDLGGAENKFEELIYPESVMLVYKKQTTWCTRMEKFLCKFITEFREHSEDASKSDVSKRWHHFPAMLPAQSNFIKELASCYELYSETQDVEAKKSLFICITNSTKIPEQTIDDQTLLEQEHERLKAELSKAQGNNEDVFFNAILIQDVFFGVVKDELEKVVMPVVESFKLEVPVLQWMRDSTYVIFSKSQYKVMDVVRENDLYLLTKSLRKVVRSNSLAFDCKLCLIDDTSDFILKVEKSTTTSKVEEDNKSLQQLQRNQFNVLSEGSVF